MFSVAYNCAAAKPTSIASPSGNANTTWLSYSAFYTANKTNPILIFGFDASSVIYLVIDDVSVVDTTNSSVQLLTNPSFENSTSGPTRWTAWCTSSCNAGTAGNVTNSGCRTGMCYKSGCNGGTANVDYLGQAFSAVIGRTYNITFWSQRVRFSTTMGASTATLYAGII